MSTHRFGPLRFEIQTRELEEVLTGLRVALRRYGEPIDPDQIPEGWELRHENHPRGPWPTAWTRRTGYWLTIWKRGSGDGAYVKLKPYDGAWMVEYASENRWNGGECLGRGFSFDDAVDVAIDAMTRVDDGATERDLWMDYKDWGESE
ncbi:hypothetical protein HTZ84_22520 [Haloterrigena sp. SYSU A558-1]|uniref:DUF5619 domain-containing protein n=1 Tax=Haloterrigena gelatinilytica TaxID=2741724 RepID=A0ABX2LI24_9EURY|nr:hypothetical protein [Haloterrigena gelatinilytica]NUC75043.1 hypothetical protein [Haloterrigena gelatinilytica]